MALPLDFYETFEAGTKGAFDSESDVGQRLDFPHARDLAPFTPYRGAYCCRVNLGKNSEDAYLEEAVSWAASPSSIRWGRFRMYVGSDVQFGNNLDNVRVLQFRSASANEASLRLVRVDPMGIVLMAMTESESVSSDNGCFRIPVGEWFTVEWKKYTDSSGSGGVLVAFLPDSCVAPSNHEVDAAIAKVRLGAMGQIGDIQGTILIDDFAVDESRLYDDQSAHNGALSDGSMFFLQSGFAFLGAGEIEHISLIDGGSGNCRVKVYDTDDPLALPLGAIRENLATLAANATEQSRSRGFRCSRGCYVELSGTNPQALVRLGKVDGDR